VTEAAARLRHGTPLLLWLVLVWNLLWGTWSWANLLSGFAVALVVTLLLPLPPVTTGLRFRPVGLLVFAGRFLLDLVISTAQVAWLALRPGAAPRSAIISVQLRTDSDLLLTVLAQTLSLIPGSIVIDLDREHQRIGLHVLGVRSEHDVEDQRRRVLAQEDRVVRAFGGPEDIAALDQPLGAPSTAGEGSR